MQHDTRDGEMKQTSKLDTYEDVMVYLMYALVLSLAPMDNILIS